MREPLVKVSRRALAKAWLAGRENPVCCPHFWRRLFSEVPSGGDSAAQSPPSPPAEITSFPAYPAPRSELAAALLSGRTVHALRMYTRGADGHCDDAADAICAGALGTPGYATIT